MYRYLCLYLYQPPSIQHAAFRVYCPVNAARSVTPSPPTPDRDTTRRHHVFSACLRVIQRFCCLHASMITVWAGGKLGYVVDRDQSVSSRPSFNTSTGYPGLPICVILGRQALLLPAWRAMYHREDEPSAKRHKHKIKSAVRAPLLQQSPLEVLTNVTSRQSWLGCRLRGLAVYHQSVLFPPLSSASCLADNHAE